MPIFRHGHSHPARRLASKKEEIMVKLETGVLTTPGRYSIHFEYHYNVGAKKTVVMVNGALATTTSFSQTIRNFKDHANIVLFDLPFAGRSRDLNRHASGILSKDDEVEILLYLIEYFEVHFIVSASWGGVATLLSLTQRPPSIEKAVIRSFSPVINDAMHKYMVDARQFLRDGDIAGGAELLNRTVGKYLPRLLKTHNHQYLLSVIQGNEPQILFHIDQIFHLDRWKYIDQFASIDVPILFVNGALDEYTTADDARSLSRHIRRSQFAVIPEAGHFLELEGSRVRRATGVIERKFLFGNDPIIESLGMNRTSDECFYQASC